MNKLFKISALSVIGVLSAILLAGPVAATLRTTAVFNAYDGVQLHYGVGSESDFLRLGNSGEMGNTMEVCEDGQTVDLWFYIHNSTAESANGENFDGPGVATNTVVSLDVDEQAEANSHSVVASIDSDQTNPIADDVTITCADENIRLVYKAVTHFGTKAPALTPAWQLYISGRSSGRSFSGLPGRQRQGSHTSLLGLPSSLKRPAGGQSC